MSAKRRVGLLFGGRSVEHEVSLRSARAVRSGLEAAGFTCVPLGVTGQGRWLSPELSDALLSSSAVRAEPEPGQDDGARVVIDPGGGLVCTRAGRAAEPVGLDVLFPLVHGWGGEDGRVQGALDLAGIPYVGSGVSGSAIGMDKVLARQLCDAQGLPSVRWMAFDGASRASGALQARRIAAELAFPVFVKPANGGSSVGVTRVAGPSGLAAAIDEAFACDTRIVVEQGVDAAREIECAVLGNERPEPSVLGEIVPSREFYDYTAKYLEDGTELKIPAPLEPELEQAIRAHAVSAFRALGLSGLARVDFLLDPRGGQVYLNEVNTLPGFTSISMFPKLWEASGLAFPRLVTRLVELALARWEETRSLRTCWKPA